MVLNNCDPAGVVTDIERHRVELRFQFGPVEVTLGPGLWTRATAGGHSLLVRPFATVPLQAGLRRGSCQPMEGWVSPDYGQRQPAPVIVYSTTAPLPLRIVTLLLFSTNFLSALRLNSGAEPGSATKAGNQR